MRRNNNAIAIFTFTFVILSGVANIHTYAEPETDPLARLTKEKSCSYLITKDNENVTYYAKNCANGSLIFVGYDAATVINNVIAASSPGSLILIDGGGYRITSPININKSIAVSGRGSIGTNGVTVLINNQNNTMLNVTSSFVIIKDMTLFGTGNIHNANDIGLKISNSNNVDISNLMFANHYNDLVFSGTVFYTNIINVGFNSATNDLVFSDNTADINVRFIGGIGFVKSANNGFNLQGLDSVVFDSVETSGNFSGTVLILDRQRGGIVAISNSMFENSNQLHRSLWIKGIKDNPIKSVLISNSYFSGGNKEADEPAAQIDNGLDLSIHGSYISGIWKGLKINNLNKMIIEGNIFELTGDGIFTDENSTLGNLTVSDNSYHTVGSHLVNFSKIKSIKGPVLIEGNNVVGSRGFAFYPGTWVLVINNVGFNPQSPSIIKSDMSPFRYTNYDGYPEMILINNENVSQISLRGINTNLTSGSFLIQPFDSITITFDNTKDKTPLTMVRIPQ
jgi:hypothetical protein